MSSLPKMTSQGLPCQVSDSILAMLDYLQQEISDIRLDITNIQRRISNDFPVERWENDREFEDELKEK